MCGYGTKVVHSLYKFLSMPLTDFNVIIDVFFSQLLLMNVKSFLELLNAS